MVNDETVIPVMPDVLTPVRRLADVEAETRENLKPENMEHLDPDVMVEAGHPGHMHGGAEVMWLLNSQLLDATRRFAADTVHFQRRISELEVLLSRPKTCRHCGESV